MDKIDKLVRVEDKILQDILAKDFVVEGEAYVKKINSNLFLVGGNKTTNIWYFCDREGKVIFSLKSIRRHHFVIGASIEAGYWEKKNKEGEYEMYKIKHIEKKGGEYKPKLGEKIDKYSMEYYNAWNYISFAEDRIGIKSFSLKGEEEKAYIKNNNNILLSNQEGYYFVLSQLIEIWSHSQAIRLRDLIRFYKQDQLVDKATLEEIRDNKIEGKEREKLLSQANERIFWESVKIVEETLLSQIGDKKFHRVNDDVTVEEINRYYWYGYDKKKGEYISIKEEKDIINKIMKGEIEHKPLISQRMYDICIEKLKELEEIQQQEKQEEAKADGKFMEEVDRMIEEMVD